MNRSRRYRVLGIPESERWHQEVLAESVSAIRSANRSARQLSFIGINVKFWRREWDSNPRVRLPELRAFQARLFGHSSTSPETTRSYPIGQKEARLDLLLHPYAKTTPAAIPTTRSPSPTHSRAGWCRSGRRRVWTRIGSSPPRPPVGASREESPRRRAVGSPRYR